MESNIKETTLEVLKSMPDNSSIEDILHEVNLVAQVFEGLDDEKNGRTISTQEMLKRIQSWKQK